MSRHSSRAVRRAPILAVLAAALLAGALLDRAGGPAGSGQPVVETVQPMPVAAPAAALSSSWFCAGATDGGTVPMPGKVVVANDSSQAVTGTVTVVGSSAKPRRVPVSVPAYGVATVAETVPGGSQWVGAIVDLDGGSVGVDQVDHGPLGRSTTPCATSGSPHWYLPSGQTRVNADEAIILLNPYHSGSVVDLTFTTDQGIEVPQAFQAIYVPPGGLVGVDVGSQLRRRSAIAATVSTQSGSVVAFQTSWVTQAPAGVPLVGTPAASSPLADPAAPSQGSTVTLGAPSAGRSWVWPDGLAGDGINEEYVIYNPGPRPADVRLSIGLQQGSAEPFSLNVGPYQVATVVSEQSARIPPGVAHSATLTSVNGVPVVAARVITATNASAPGGTRNGIGQLLGARLSASRWLLPAALSGAAHHGHVVVYNPGVAPVKAHLSALHSGTGTFTTVPAAGRVDIPLPAGVSFPVELQASGPVYVEYDLYGATGLSLSLGIPLS